jgi:TolB protein
MKKYLCLFLAVAAVSPLFAADEVIDLSRERDSLGFTKPIPVSLAGFTGEADSTLRFDLFFMGFEFVSPDKARYNIQKNNAAGMGAQITDPLARQIIYNKAFTGASARQQAHALADDIARTLTKKPGIAQTRIATKVQPSGYGDGEIWVADYDGYNAAPVTKDNAICAAPTWAGKSELLYVSYKLMGKPDILSHNLTTGARKALYRQYPGSSMSPAVSPDGQRIAFIHNKAGSPDLYVSDLDGGNLKQLTKTKEDESSPCWSPDSRTICFASRQTGKPALYTISANGGAMSRIPLSAASPTEPDWSPDGKYIVFTTPTSAGFQICVSPMEGNLRGAVTTLVAGEDPVWAPNSRAVIFVRNVNNRRVLALLDVPSKQTKDIVRISGSASQPSWAR